MDCDNVLENSLNLITSFLISLLSFQSVFFSVSTNEWDGNNHVQQQQQQQESNDNGDDDDGNNSEKSGLFKLDELYGIYHQLQITHSERCIAIALLEILTPSSSSSNYDSSNKSNKKSTIGYGNDDEGSCNTSFRTITPSLIEDIHFVTNRACQRDAVIQFDSHCREAINELVIGFLQSGVNCCLQQSHHRQSFSPTSTNTTPISPIPMNSRTSSSSSSTSSSISIMKKKVVVVASEDGFDKLSPASTKTNQDNVGRNSTRILDDTGFISFSFHFLSSIQSIHF